VKKDNTQTLTISRWHPAKLNEWHGAHWSRRARLKRFDREIVGLFAKLAGIPVARGKRRVSLRLTLAPGQRAGDPDAYWKSLLDSLVHCRLLLDDNAKSLELGQVSFTRGAVPETEIVLEEITCT
jgi:hypothetical protein